MKSILVYFILGALNAIYAASTSSLDSAIIATTHDQVMNKLNLLRDELPLQELIDLSIAIRTIERQCENQVSINKVLTEKESDKLFVSLINGQTPRQIILAASLLMLAESQPLGAEENLEASKLKGESVATWSYLIKARSLGIGFVHTYTK